MLNSRVLRAAEVTGPMMWSRWVPARPGQASAWVNTLPAPVGLFSGACSIPGSVLSGLGGGCLPEPREPQTLGVSPPTSTC